MTEDELQHMKQTLHDLCNVVLRIQIDLQSQTVQRDQFAMAALSGCLAGRANSFERKEWAEAAYELADAMMEARK